MQLRIASADSLAMTSASKMAQRRVAAPQLPDAVLRDDWRGELGSPRQVVSEVEARVFSERLPGSNLVNCRTKAAELHKEADRLYFKGDYESALVLYHRSAKLCPREVTHSVAARRAETAIKRAANPGRRLARLLREARVPGQEAAVLDPEAAARRAKEIVTEAQDPLQEIPRILRYLDAREDFWRISSPANTPRVSRSGSMRRQLNKCVRSTVKDVEAARDSETIRKLSDELLSLVSLTDEPNRNQVDALGYLATKQLELGRHDRAIDLAAKMFFRARTDNDTLAIVNALSMIGRVHLCFGHLSALAQVWQRLVGDLSKESVAQAWLYHDIGRCQFELNEYGKAHEAASLCIERAESVGCKKWILRGYLLKGQSLLKLARLAEAVSALKVTAKIAAEQEMEEEQVDHEKSILVYVHGLIDQVTCLLRRLNQQTDVDRRASASEAEDETDMSDLEEMRKQVTLMCREEHQIDQPAVAPLQSQSQEEVVRLLARTRALRAPKDNGHLQLLPADLSDVAKDETLAMDTSRTCVIGKTYDEDEQTLGPEELIPLTDFSLEDDLTSSDEGQNFVEEAVAKPMLYSELTSRSLVSSLDRPRESTVTSVKQPIRTNILSDYLRSLESQEFLAQERQYIAGIKSAE